MEKVEVILVALIIIDFVAKIVSHVMLLTYQSKLDKEECDTATSYLHAELIVQKNREYTISTFVVLMDAFLTIIVITMFSIYKHKDTNETLNYMDAALLLLGRGYLKLPMTVCLYNHHK